MNVVVVNEEYINGEVVVEARKRGYTVTPVVRGGRPTAARKIEVPNLEVALELLGATHGSAALNGELWRVGGGRNFFIRSSSEEEAEKLLGEKFKKTPGWTTVAEYEFMMKEWR